MPTRQQRPAHGHADPPHPQDPCSCSSGHNPQACSNQPQTRRMFALRRHQQAFIAIVKKPVLEIAALARKSAESAQEMMTLAQPLIQIWSPCREKRRFSVMCTPGTAQHSGMLEQCCRDKGGNLIRRLSWIRTSTMAAAGQRGAMGRSDIGKAWPVLQCVAHPPQR